MYVAPKYRDLLWFAGMAMLIGLFLAVAYYAALGWVGLMAVDDEPEHIIVELEPNWREPYGGCKEAYLYPESPGYAECVEHGLIP